MKKNKPIKKVIKNWLGITKLENIVGEEKVEETTGDIFSRWFMPSLFYSSWGDTTLVTKHKKLREDFEELDKKFDALERYLQIEYYKEDKEIQIYDWANKKHSEGFRKSPKTYDQMKKAEDAYKVKEQFEDEE